MKSVLSILLALLLLCSNMGLTLATHYCGGHAVESSISIGENKLDCGMMDNDSPYESNPTNKETAHPIDCCQNEYQVIDAVDNFKTSAEKISLDPHFVFSLAFTLLDLHLAEAQYTDYSDYLPPPDGRDLPVLYQTFLI